MDESKKLAIYKELLIKIKKSNYNALETFYSNYKEQLDLNQIDDDKRTPLIHAIVSKNYDAVKFLLEHNVHSNKSDSV